MFISGFTFVRNAIKYDYPIRESIQSILPIVDEMVVAVGDSEDETLKLIQSIDSKKIRIIHTKWDDSLRKGGVVLAKETDKAFAEISQKADWAFYIQADEVIHEKYHKNILDAARQHLDNKKVEGLLFQYKHFYGSYDWITNTRDWYRQEIRIVRPLKGIHSYQDAQGFRLNNRKIHVKQIPAEVFHYGWVKSPEKQYQKQRNFHKLWHDNNWVEQQVPKGIPFNYNAVQSLSKFKGTHPKVMRKRVQEKNWNFEFDTSKIKLTIKEKVSRFIESITGYRIGEYKN